MPTVTSTNSQLRSPREPRRTTTSSAGMWEVHCLYLTSTTPAEPKHSSFGTKSGANCEAVPEQTYRTPLPRRISRLRARTLLMCHPDLSLAHLSLFLISPLQPL